MDDERRCTANSKRTGQRCGRARIPGLAVCRFHGGGTKAAKAKAAEHRAAEVVRNHVAVFASSIEVDPAQALLDEVNRTAGVVAWLEQQITKQAGAGPEALVKGTKLIRRTDRGDGTVTETVVGPQVSAWWDMWVQQRKHLADVCRMVLATGIEARQLEQQTSVHVVDEPERPRTLGDLVAGDPIAERRLARAIHEALPRPQVIDGEAS